MADLLKLMEDYIRFLCGVLPQKLARIVEVTLNIGDIYGAGFKWKGKFYGTLNIFLKKGSKLENINALEILIRLASVALQRREAEDALQRTTEELERVIESSPAAIAVFDLDGRVRRWSPAAEIIFGWTADEAIGRFNPTVPPEYKDVFIEQLELLRERKTFPPIEINPMRKDGSRLYISLSAAPLYDASGNVEGIVGVMTDVTDRKQAELKLKESENKYRAIFENTGAATIIFDPKGIITMQNSEMGNMSGYLDEEVEGKMKWMEFVPPRELKMLLQYHQKRQIDPESVPSRYESKFITKDGSIRNAQITVDKIPGSDEYASSINDITDLKSAEKDLKKVMEEKEVLLKEIHHWVKNNLMIISSLLNIQSSYIKDKAALDVFRESQNRAKSMDIIHEKL
ncbi:MAG: PAS domain S-box protein [Euryarchaeota archaeon]|nr:PAS domain S-box protein [Euryarchaeota archaeon]